ncbi:MAG: hypothetical protein Q9172_007403 [Xanthocarpia lactea]
MVHAPPKIFPVVRRLESVSIRRLKCLNIRRRWSERPSIPELTTHHVATNSKYKSKRLAKSSDVGRREGVAEFQSPKPGLSPIHRRSGGDEISPNEAIDRYLERVRSLKDRLHPSKFIERCVITTPKFKYRFTRRRLKVENPDHQPPNSPAHRADGTSSQHSVAASTGQDYAEQMPGPVRGILRKVQSERHWRLLRKVQSERHWRHYRQQRAFLTSAQRPAPSSTAPSTPEPISIDQFHRLADQYIDNLVSKLEELQEERRDVDCEYSAGVLNLDFPPAGTYVFNKQPPNKQIWLSSPISGPKRYDYVLIPSSSPETSETSTGGDGAARSGVGFESQEKKADWVYLRDGSTLSELLKEELDIDMEDV